MGLREACLALDKLRDNGVRTLIVSGGEPLLYEHIWDLLSYGADLGFDMNLMTNATLLDSKTADVLGSFDLPVWLSLDFFNERAQRAWRRGGSFRNMFGFIEKYLMGSMSVGIRSTILWSNLADVKAVASFCRSHKIPMIAMRVINCRIGSSFREPSQVDLRELYEGFVGWNRRYHSNLLIDDPPFYLFKYDRVDSKGRPDYDLDDVFVAQGNEKFSQVCESLNHRVSVDPRGNVFPCPFLATSGLRYGNLFSDDWSVIEDRHRVFRGNLEYNCACGEHCWFLNQPFGEDDERYRLVKGCNGGCVARSYWRYARDAGVKLSIDELVQLPLFDENCPYYGGVA